MRPRSEKTGCRGYQWRVDAGRETVGGEDLVQGVVVEPLARAVVEPVDYFLQPLQVERKQVLAPGHDLAAADRWYVR